MLRKFTLKVNWAESKKLFVILKESKDNKIDNIRRQFQQIIHSVFDFKKDPISTVKKESLKLAI